MSKGKWEKIFGLIGVFVILSMLLGTVPASASYVPRAVSWEEYAAGLASASSPEPASLSQEARSLSLREQALLMGAVRKEVTPPPADSSPYPILLPLDEHPIAGTSAQSDATPEASGSHAASSDTTALPVGSGPTSTWDKLKSQGSEKSNLVVDDEGTATPDKGGKLKTKDGWLTVEFPPGAVSETVSLKYKRAGNAPHPVLDSRDTYYAFGLLAETKDGKKITKFSQPITITLTYQEGSGINEGAGVFYWHEEDGGYWSFVPCILDADARTIVVSSLHFSDYAISDANQIEPDVINSGHSNTGTNMLTGASTYQYSIQVPPGINGLQPNLRLEYNSQAKKANAGTYDQASTVGWNWNLKGIPYIIQTKKNTASGVGIIYSLVMDGIGGELVKTGTADDSWRTSNESVTRIVRIYNPPQRGWVITTKDGTQYKLEDPWNEYATRGINYLDDGTGCSDYIWRFSTTVITDTVGNTMSLNYIRDTGTTTCRGTNYNITTAVYPAYITYAGGPYEVRFIYTAGRTDYYSGSQQQAEQSLSEIKVWDRAANPDRLIRKYVLSQGYFTTKDDTGAAYTRLKLQSITPYGDGGTAALPSISFTYALQKYLDGALPYPPELRLLKQIDNGYGGTVDYVYEDVPDVNGAHYWHERVDALADGDGLGSVYTYTYSYGTPRRNSKLVSEEQASRDSGNTIIRHLLNGEFRGHDWAQETGPDGKKTKVSYALNDYAKGLLTSVTTAGANIDSNLYLTSTTSYNTSTTDVSAYNSPWQYVMWYQTDMTSVVERSFENSNSSGRYKETKVEYVYDANRNVQQERYYGDTSVTGDEKTVYHEYFDDSTRWMKNRRYRESAYAGIGTGGTLLTRVRYYYDNDDSSQTTSMSRGLLTHSMAYTDDTHTVNTRYGYDSYGNQTVITDTRGYATKTDYDTTYHVYPVKVTNTLGHVKTTDYDWGFGAPTVITDANGNVTRYAYDAFGRKVKEALPGDDLSSPTTETDYSHYDNVPTAQQSVVITQSGTIAGRTWTDGLGRTYQASRTGPDGKCFVQSKVLDSAGRPSKDYTQFLNATCPSQYVSPPAGTRYTSYGYDAIGRTVVVTNTDGTSQKTAYGLRIQPGVAALSVVTNTDANGHGKVSYSDPTGKLVKVEQLKGASPNFTVYATTVYTYDMVGNQTGIQDAKGNIGSMTYDWLGRKLTMSDPDAGDWTYSYDAAGNLTQQVDAKSQTMNFQYDAIGRMTKKLEGSTPVITYTYDSALASNGKGQRTGMEDPSGSTTWSYTNRGKVSQETKTITGDSTYTTTFTYDSLGRLERTIYPDGVNVDNIYNPWGPLAAVQTGMLGELLLYETSYNELGQPTHAKFGNYFTQFSLDNTYRSDNYRLETSTAITGTKVLPVMRSEYSYDSVGNITSTTVTDRGSGGTRSETSNFTYDEMDRLISATGAYTQSWAIDEIGRTTVFTRENVPYTYAYTDTAHPHAATQLNYTTVEDSAVMTDTYGYDANGSTTYRNEIGTADSSTYDVWNQLTQVVDTTEEPEAVVTTTYTYDGDGARVKKVVTSSTISGTATSTTYYVNGLYEKTDGVVTKHYSLVMGVRAQKVVSGTEISTSYVFGDQLGSASMVLDGAGDVQEIAKYFPYGEIRLKEGKDLTPYLYNDQEFDESSDLYYYGARYYNPRLGQFSSADMAATDPNEPLSLNRYAYVLGNPVNMTDPTGNVPKYFANHQCAPRGWSATSNECASRFLARRYHLNTHGTSAAQWGYDSNNVGVLEWFVEALEDFMSQADWAPGQIGPGGVKNTGFRYDLLRNLLGTHVGTYIAVNKQEVWINGARHWGQFIGDTVQPPAGERDLLGTVLIDPWVIDNSVFPMAEGRYLFAKVIFIHELAHAWDWNTQTRKNDWSTGISEQMRVATHSQDGNPYVPGCDMEGCAASNYGGTVNHIEDFAEAVAYYVYNQKGPRYPNPPGLYFNLTMSRTRIDFLWARFH